MRPEQNGSLQAVTWETAPQTKEETLELLRRSPGLYRSYRALNDSWKEQFLDFCQGKKSLPLTYDPFFKYLFDPELHRERLSRFISSLLGFQVRILHVLPGEDRLIEGESYLIMDLLAEAEDGSLYNVEVQKQAYAFPAERISCYSADLVMRQYMRAKREKEGRFSYRDIKKVYVIVLYENSSAAFRRCSGAYLHYGKTIFNTGLELELLQEFCLAALDVYRKIPYPEREKNEQNAWLSLLTTENLSDAEELVRDYPWLEEIYQEIAMLRRKPEEVLGMWSDALRILDENTMKLYVEELEEKLQKTLEEKEQEKMRAEEKLRQITKEKAKEQEKFRQLTEEKDAQIAALEKKLNHNLDRDLDYFSTDIKRMIADEIVKRFYYQKGSIIQQLKDDNELKAALAILNDTAKYRRILSPDK